MNILNYLLGLLMIYWLDVLVVVIFVVVMIFLLRRNKADLVKRIIFYLVVQAEKELGSKTGPLKYSMVVAAVYERLPIILRAIFTQADIDAFINQAVENLKLFLNSGSANLLGYYEEADYEVIKALEEKAQIQEP